MSNYLILIFNFIILFSDNKVYYQIFDIDLNFYNNALRGKDYNYYNGRYLNERDKENFLKIIPQQGLKLSSEISLSFLSFSYHFWNLTASFNLRSKGRIEKEIFDLLLFGNKINQTYQLKESKGEIFIFSQIKNTFNFSIKNDWKTDFGISYLQGHHHLKMENNYLYLLTTKEFFNLYNEINYKKSAGGIGFSFDIGLEKKIKEDLGLKIMIENLINRMVWYKENRIGKIVLTIDSLNLNKITTGNCYSFTKEEKETTEFRNNILPTKISLSLENEIKDFLKINPGLSLRIKEFLNFFTQIYYQPFDFLFIFNLLNFYFLTSKDISFESFSYEIGVGLRIAIKKFDVSIFQGYYKGFLLNAKGFSFKLGFGYNFSY